MRSADDGEEILGRAFDRALATRLWAAARPHRRLVLGALALFPPIAALELLQPWLLKIAIDEHILHGDWTGLTVIALVYALVLGALYGLRSVEAYLMALTGERVIHGLRRVIFEHLLRLDAAFYDRTPVGRVMTRTVNDVDAVGEAFTSGLFAVVADVVTLAGAMAVMLWLDWRLALVTYAIVPVLFVAAGWFRRRARVAYREVRARVAALNAYLQESLQGMSVIQLFAREADERRRFAALNASYRRALFRSTIFEAALYAVVEAIGSIALAILIWYGGGRIVSETLTFGALVAFIQYTNRFFLPIRDLGAKYTVMQSAMASAERIFGLLDRAPAIVAPARPRTPAVSGAGRAEFRGVWFAYQDEHWVLRDCSWSLAPGEHVALVGATGEGKSTCARLLNRSYDVTRGAVHVDGIDVREWDLAQLRQRVGMVFQDSVLFAGTVAENLALGRSDVGRAELERAIDGAAMRSLLDALPHGLDEPLVERGANLSHGQRQLLAIARALVYNPAILVLDEATSSVDPESEWMIRDALKRLLTGRTTLTIAHRLSTVAVADRILVLHRGRVAESGSHAALLRQGGLYARLHELQVRAAAV